MGSADSVFCYFLPSFLISLLSPFSIFTNFCMCSLVYVFVINVFGCFTCAILIVLKHDSLAIVVFLFSPTAESFGVSAQIGSGVVRGGPDVRFHEGSTTVPPGFHQGSTRFCEGCGVVRALKRASLAVGDIT